MQLTWEKLALKRLRLLREWRHYARYVVEAVKRIAPSARVYLIGSVAEGTYTALSDVDILVILPGRHSSRDLIEASIRIWEEAFRLGLPWDYPINLIVVDEDRAKPFLRSARRLEKLY